ncbi:MAG: phospholipase D-like domain-containing protein [Gammaproteobacteria bacterium]
MNRSIRAATTLVSILLLAACATPVIKPEDCPEGTQRIEGCPPVGAIDDTEIAAIYTRRADDPEELRGIEAVDFARYVDIPATPARAKFIGSNDEGAVTSIAAKLWMIENAEHTVDVMYYIFREDLVGFGLLGALCDAVRRGVDVRVMIDSIGSSDFSRKNLKALESCAIDGGFVQNRSGRVTIYKARAQTAVFNAFTTTTSNPNRRSHDKLVVKDGRFQGKAYAITGGRNVSLDYYGFLEDGSPNPHSYRDAEILLRGSPGDQVGALGIGDVSAGYFTLLFVFDKNKHLQMSGGDPAAAYAKQRETFREALATLKALPTVKAQLDRMPEVMTTGFRDVRALLAHELANVTNRNVVTKAVENLADSPNSIIGIMERLVTADNKRLQIVSPYLFAARYKDSKGNVIVDEAKDLLEWLEAHPESEIDIVTNSVLTSDNFFTQSVIDLDLVPRLLLTEDFQEQWAASLQKGELNPEFVESEAWAKMVDHPRLRIYETGTLEDERFGGHYHHSKLHAKYVVGDAHGFVGTTNFDYRSRLYNSEMGYFFESKELADDIAANTDYLISLSYRWGSPEWLELRKRVGELEGQKGYTTRHQRGIYKTIRNTGLMWLF